MSFFDVSVFKSSDSPEIPYNRKNLLLEDSGLDMADKLKIMYAIGVSEVTSGLIVSEWIKYPKFHL